jgi:hypothetical protein
MKQRCDIEELRVKFQISSDPIHGAEYENPKGVVEQHPCFMLAYQLLGFSRDLAVGDFDAGNDVSHGRTRVLDAGLGSMGANSVFLTAASPLSFWPRVGGD